MGKEHSDSYNGPISYFDVWKEIEDISNCTSEDIAKAIKKLRQARYEVKKREEEERQRKKHEERERCEKEKRERKESHVRKLPAWISLWTGKIYLIQIHELNVCIPKVFLMHLSYALMHLEE